LPSTTAQHLAKAAWNERASVALASMGYLDWAVTTMFYAVLHLVEAYFTNRGVRSKTHGRRELAIRQDSHLQPLHYYYMQLKDVSLQARYDCEEFTAAEVQLLRNDHFDPLKRELTLLIAR